MSRTRTSFKLIAIATMIALQMMAIPTFAQSSAALSGTVMQADRTTPIPGARVHLADAQSGELVGSAPTAEDGTFQLDAIPGSEYRIAVETDGGLYVVSAPVTLTDGETQQVHLAINPKKGTSDDAAKAATHTLGFWNNPVTAALLILGGVIVLGYAIEEITDEDKASPS